MAEGVSVRAISYTAFNRFISVSPSSTVISVSANLHLCALGGFNFILFLFQKD
jgi:hypothetical protein